MAQRSLPAALAAEAILPRAQRRKHGELVLKWLAGVLLGRAAHRSDGAAQKRVVASLKRDRRRQAWRVIRTQVADFGNAGLQVGIAGFDRARECEIRRGVFVRAVNLRSEEHTSELQSLMRISYAVFCLK